MVEEILKPENSYPVNEALPVDLRVFEAMPGTSVLLMSNMPDFTVVAATAQYLQHAALTKEQLIGRGIFEAFPPSPGKPFQTGETNLSASFEKVLQSKAPHIMAPYRYDTKNERGDFTEKHWSVINSPVLDAQGEVSYIIHTPTEITHQVKASKREEAIRGIEQAHALFMQAPVAIHIIKGPQLIIGLANEHTLRLWGKDKNVVGKKLEEALPEIKGTGIAKMLHNVRESGRVYDAYETPVTLVRYGKAEDIVVSFVFQPYYEEDSAKAAGVLVIASEVTERVKIKGQLAAKERSLRQSEQRLRSIIAAAPAAIGLFVGRDLIVEMPNQAFIDIVGKGLDIEGKPLREVMPELITENQPFLQILDDVYTSGKPFQSFGSQVNIVQAGVMTHKYYNITYTPLLDEAGKVFAILDIAIDVTEQVAARRKSEETGQQVRSIVESAPFPIGVYVGKEMKIVLANQAILDAWGKGADVIGKTYSEVLPELENQHIYQQLDDVYTTGKAFHAKNQRVDLVVDGMLQTFYFNYSFTPLFDAAGNVYGVMNTAADVSDLAFARQKVEESEKNLRQMVLQAPVAMGILKGPDFVVETANERMFELWGKLPEVMLNKPVFEGLPEAREQGLEALLQAVYNTGRTFHAFERPVNLPRGAKIETTYLNFVYEPMYEVNGVINGVIAVAIEVTDQVLSRRKIEEAVAQRTSELAEANEALLHINQELARSNANLEEFAYAASHDLKEPIRKIHFFSSLIKDRLQNKLEEEDLRLFGRMETASRRMSSLIEDLLTYSQVSRRPKVFDEVDMNALINQVLADLDLEIEEKDALVQVDKLFNFKGHQRQLQQAFYNLIGNALKYSKPGVAPQIRLSCGKIAGAGMNIHLSPEEKEKHFHVIEVADNGIGFEQKDAERIFNVFTRLHGNAEYKGTGVGLSIVRKVIENHHGYVVAESNGEEGAVFKIFLPAA